MIHRSVSVLAIFFCLISFYACSSGEEDLSTEENEPVEFSTDGIEITDAWARPAREDGNSAIYMEIKNGSMDADTLLSLSSPVAGMVEVHESYEQDEGMMAMRPVEPLIAPARDVLSLEPGGIHVMLMQLNQALAEGDSIQFTADFATSGEIKVTVPVQMMKR